MKKIFAVTFVAFFVVGTVIFYVLTQRAHQNDALMVEHPDTLYDPATKTQSMETTIHSDGDPVRKEPSESVETMIIAEDRATDSHLEPMTPNLGTELASSPTVESKCQDPVSMLLMLSPEEVASVKAEFEALDRELDFKIREVDELLVDIHRSLSKYAREIASELSAMSPREQIEFFEELKVEFSNIENHPIVAILPEDIVNNSELLKRAWHDFLDALSSAGYTAPPNAKL